MRWNMVLNQDDLSVTVSHLLYEFKEMENGWVESPEHANFTPNHVLGHRIDIR